MIGIVESFEDMTVNIGGNEFEVVLIQLKTGIGIIPVIASRKVFDLTGLDSYVLWNSGYEINGDFTASLWGRNFNDNSQIISLSDGIQTLTVNFRKDENNFSYAELIVKEGFYTYYIYTDSIYIYPEDKLQIWFRRIGSLYEIGLYDLSERPTLILDSSAYGLIGINILG